MKKLIYFDGNSLKQHTIVDLEGRPAFVIEARNGLHTLNNNKYYDVSSMCPLLAVVVINQ